MSQRVFITGGAGYLGSILIEHLLQAGYRVSVLDNLLYGQQTLLHFCANPNFEFTYGDARDPQLIRRLTSQADVVIPLAAIVGAPACDQEPELARTINRDAIRLLTEEMSPSQLLLIPITNSGYGTKSGAVHCTEDSPLEPISLYGLTKVEAETIALQREQTISLRLATVFGMSPRLRLDLLVNNFVYTAMTEGCLVLFEEHFKRNYVHIRDVADCFIHCLNNPQQMVGKPFNLGLDAANLSKLELAHKVKKYIHNLYIHCAPLGKDPDQRNYIVSNQRLREAGFEATRDLDQGIKELLKGYRMLGRDQGKNVTSVRPCWLTPKQPASEQTYTLKGIQRESAKSPEPTR